MAYNLWDAALRAIGDTERPLFFLIISGVTNVVLNLIFVIFLKLDVAGVALATIISEALSAFLVLRCLSKETGPWRFDVRRLPSIATPFMTFAVSVFLRASRPVFSVFPTSSSKALSILMAVWS